MPTIPAPLAAATGSLANRLVALAASALALGARVARALRHRRAVDQLLDLDDRALRDIGLTRSDVQAALSMPVIRDPSFLLTVRAVDRRSRLRLTAAAPSRLRPVETVAS